MSRAFVLIAVLSATLGCSERPSSLSSGSGRAAPAPVESAEAVRLNMIETQLVSDLSAAQAEYERLQKNFDSYTAGSSDRANASSQRLVDLAKIEDKAFVEEMTRREIELSQSVFDSTDRLYKAVTKAKSDLDAANARLRHFRETGEILSAPTAAPSPTGTHPIRERTDRTT